MAKTGPRTWGRKRWRGDSLSSGDLESRSSAWTYLCVRDPSTAFVGRGIGTWEALRQAGRCPWPAHTEVLIALLRQDG